MVPLPYIHHSIAQLSLYWRFVKSCRNHWMFLRICCTTSYFYIQIFFQNQPVNGCAYFNDFFLSFIDILSSSSLKLGVKLTLLIKVTQYCCTSILFWCRIFLTRVKSMGLFFIEIKIKTVTMRGNSSSKTIMCYLPTENIVWGNASNKTNRPNYVINTIEA